MTNDWDLLVGKIIQDLERCSPDLIEKGVSSGQSAKLTHSTGAKGGYSRILSLSSQFSAITPELLADASRVSVSTRDVDSHFVPARATASRCGADFGMYQGTVVPLVWLRPKMEEEPDPLPIRWALGIHVKLVNELSVLLVRYEKFREDALIAKQDTGSEYHANEQIALEELISRIRSAMVALNWAGRQIRGITGNRLSPLETMPLSLPSTRSWLQLRKIARALNPALQDAVSFAKDLLAAPVNIADIPFLYQRWCALQLVKAIASRGWTASGDFTGALFLGGRVAFRHEESEIELWVEPRFGGGSPHPSGLQVTSGNKEQSPDLVLITPGPAGRDAFILDPTISGTRELLEQKPRYLKTLRFHTPRTIAGVPVLRPPVRSWAASPLIAIEALTCQHFPPFDGSAGVVPMNPLNQRNDAISAWIGDILDHALAWSRVRHS